MSNENVKMKGGEMVRRGREGGGRHGGVTDQGNNNKEVKVASVPA